MMKRRFFCIFSFIAILATGCDSGDIYLSGVADAKRQVNVSFALSNTKAFPESEYYQLVLASFGEDGIYPLSFKTVPRPAAENVVVDMSLANIPDQAAFITLSLLDKGKKRIFHFYEYPVGELGDETVDLPRQDIDLATYDRVQSQIFTVKCIACHGGSNFTAAGLDLTESHSYGSLVGCPSSIRPSRLRIDPEDIAGSFLPGVLTDRDALSTDHSEMVKNDDIRLLEVWMENGCAR